MMITRALSSLWNAIKPVPNNLTGWLHFLIFLVGELALCFLIAMFILWAELQGVTPVVFGITWLFLFIAVPLLVKGDGGKR